MEQLSVRTTGEPYRFDLLYGTLRTGITIERTHQGYSHFASWIVKYRGKVKAYGLANQEEAKRQAEVVFWEMVSDGLLEQGQQP